MVRVRGRVQGVFFRYHCKQEALRLGVEGWVRNCPDGSVEALICGNEKQLAAMRNWLSHGPQLADVEEIQVESCPETGSGLQGFSIRY